MQCLFMDIWQISVLYQNLSLGGILLYFVYRVFLNIIDKIKNGICFGIIIRKYCVPMATHWRSRPPDDDEAEVPMRPYQELEIDVGKS
jgi:hypothetical protein